MPRLMGRGNVVIAVAAGLFGGLFFTVLANFSGFGGEWCGAQESGAECGRGWVGALSGWFAVLVGGASVFALIGQLREARRQTEFVVGDAPPTVSLYYPPQPLSDRVPGMPMRLRLTNWNRAPIVVSGIVPPQNDTIMIVNYLMDDTTRVFEPPYFPPTYIGGWENRSEPPESLRIDVVLAHTIADANEIIRDVTLGLKIKIIGAPEKSDTFLATLPNARIFSRSGK